MSLNPHSDFRDVSKPSPASLPTKAFRPVRVQLQTHFQPIYELRVSSHENHSYVFPTIKGFEALTRATLLNKQDVDMRSLIDACRFLSRALEKIKSGLHDVDPDELFVSINFSPQTLSLANLTDQVSETLESYAINPRSIKIEIIEDPFAENDFNQIFSNIQKLSAAGHPVVMDDMLTASSDFDRLSLLRDYLTGVKIDKSFFNLPYEEQSAVISKLQGTEVTFEGLETPEHIEIALELDARLVQGFILNKPMPMSEALHLFVDTRTYPPRPEISHIFIKRNIRNSKTGDDPSPMVA